MRTKDEVRRTADQVVSLQIRIDVLEDHIADLRSDLQQAVVRILSRIEAADKMSDRLIEMAMVRDGDSRSACGHRTQQRIEAEFAASQNPPPPRANLLGDQLGDTWDGDGEDEGTDREGEKWPPEGHQAFTMP